MKLSQAKSILKTLKTLGFQLPNGEFVPSHFHVTEIGKITKHFIDCGGTERNEQVVNFQLWNANDYDHRLHPEKLISIIELSESRLNISDLEVEVEYQGDTIGKFGLDFDGENFLLTTKQTDCLARDKCNVPPKKATVKFTNLVSDTCCSPEGNCC